MDRVLRLIFARLIRAGNLRVTTAGGSTFTFADGTGTRAAIRFTTRAAQRRVLLDPALNERGHGDTPTRRRGGPPRFRRFSYFR